MCKYRVFVELRWFDPSLKSKYIYHKIWAGYFRRSSSRSRVTLLGTFSIGSTGEDLVCLEGKGKYSQEALAKRRNEPYDIVQVLEAVS